METENPYKNVFITGASSGLGHGLAAFFCARGATVHAAARRADRLAALKADCSAKGLPGKIVPVQLDVSHSAETRKIIAATQASVGGLDLVVANAGVSEESDARRLDWEKIEKIIQVNVTGALATLTAALPDMLTRQRGHVAVVSSIAGFQPLPSYGAYAASKAFVTTFAESLRMDLVGSPVALTVIHPGFVKSEMTAASPFPMPFLMETQDAVERMGVGLLRREREIAFPWQISLAARVGRLLPSALVTMVSSRAKPAGAGWRESPLYKKAD
ncbi:MAG: SDR family NAD(P)-dependent oxidoreductase [Myxococcaceae bacterium]